MNILDVIYYFNKNLSEESAAMFTYKEHESIAVCAIEKYLKEKGCQGWDKKDIQEAIEALGGDKGDLYATMAIAIEICLGEKEMKKAVLS
ncbi:MAG: hypothetical protein ACOX4I_04310 [Anaerovoracaceae bacterium]